MKEKIEIPTFYNEYQEIKEKHEDGLLKVKKTLFSRFLYIDDKEKTRIKYNKLNSNFSLQRKNEKGKWKTKGQLYSHKSIKLNKLISHLIKIEEYRELTKKPVF